MNTLRRLSTSVLAVALMAVALPDTGSAQSFFSTGIDANANGLDDHWLVSTGNGAFVTSGFGQASILPTRTPWVANTTSGSNSFAPWFTFRQNFDLTGFNPGTASLTFQWGCDDVPGAVGFTPVFSLNGGPQSGSGTCGGYNLGAATTINSGFVSGLNTLDFFVVGNGTTDGMVLSTSSFRATQAGTPSSSVPEPASVALLGAGLLSIAGFARRRQSRS